MPGQWHLDSDTYLAMVRSEIPSYDDLQDRLADATCDLEARAILDLGSGTGVTAERVIARHPGAKLVGIDSSADMLDLARQTVPAATFLQQRLEDQLPAGPFDIVVSAFAIHHLPRAGKRRLFAQVRNVLRPRGRFVMCDVVVPTAPVDTPVAIEKHVDVPDTVADQLRWLHEARLDTTTILVNGDLAILQADRI